MHQTDPKIVVGVDFSPESGLAAEQGLRIARHLDAELVLVNVVTRLEMPPLAPNAPAIARDAMQRHQEEEARWLATDREELSSLRQRLSGQGVLVSQLLVEDSPEGGLCAAARQLGARLTVVGTVGRTGLRWLLLGSVSQRVVRMSSSDVLVARPTRVMPTTASWSRPITRRARSARSTERSRSRQPERRSTSCTSMGPSRRQSVRTR